MLFLSDNIQYGQRCEIPGIGFYITDLLTREECDNAIKFFDPNMKEIYINKDYRDMDQATLLSDEISLKLWDRIKHHFDDIKINPDNECFYGSSFDINGIWTPKGLNNYFRCSRYKAGGHFSSHRDGFYHPSLNNRSLYTFMLYINDDFTGGSTKFLVDRKCSIKDTVDLKFSCGTAIIFPHNYLHQGSIVESGFKYILRTDIMFENNTQLSSDEIRAFNLIKDASNLESDYPNNAVSLYKKAFRLCPRIENYV